MLTALALIQSFMQEAAESDQKIDILGNASVVPGLLIGGMLPFLFASMTMLAGDHSHSPAVLYCVRASHVPPDSSRDRSLYFGRRHYPGGPHAVRDQRCRRRQGHHVRLSMGTALACGETGKRQLH